MTSDSTQPTATRLGYIANGREYTVELTPLVEARRPSGEPRLRSALHASKFMAQRIASEDDVPLIAAVPSGRGSRSVAGRGATRMIATPNVIVEGARTADLKAATARGARLVHEGLDGKALLRCDTVEQAFGIARLLVERKVGSATPNFIRYRHRLAAKTTAAAWAHASIDVASAWKITRGDKGIRVAVLDEGVDTAHPDLRAAVVAAKDFIGGNGDSALPDSDDAHGTACAGIVVSRAKKAPGIAPRCSLIAARIAMGDGSDGWIFDDYSTADAIDWCWREGAAVLSNSWGGGLPSDAISRAFGRARTQGRQGRGSLVVIAAGNEQGPIDFPGALPGYVTVGASNPKHERKTRSSSDGENWWGSNHGPTLWVLAPGVFIRTTDIHGPHGYDPSDYTATFNGTSSATPHVAAAAALMLSANPALSASELRVILRETANRLKGQSGFTPELGWGRLNVGAAVREAASLPTPPSNGKKAPKRRSTKRK